MMALKKYDLKITIHKVLNIDHLFVYTVKKAFVLVF